MSSSPSNTEASNAASKPHPEARRMLTTYLPAPLIDRLHQAWLKRAQKDAKAQKAHIVTEALERFLTELETGSKTSEQPNIQTSEHPDV